MGYNIDFTRFKSSGLAGLDCGSALKIPRRDEALQLFDVYDGDLEVGQCASMVRVPKGARILNVELAWSSPATNNNTVLAVGDPFACGRFLGPIDTSRNSGFIGGLGSCEYFMCGKLTKSGRIGDGCGQFYQYTCETDIIVTNLYSARNASEGGWTGGDVVAASGKAGAKWTGGRLVLLVEYLQQS